MKYIYRTQLSVYNNMKSTATVASRDNNSIEMTDIEDQEGARAGRHKVFGTKKNRTISLQAPISVVLVEN